MKALLLVFLGGGLGSSLRFYISTILNVNELKWIPTLTVNLLGCLLLGGFLAAFQKEELTYQWYVLLGIGFCGGLTTFSTFSVELFLLLKNASYVTALLYLLLSISLGIAAAALSFSYINKII
ncbi:camphor resistance protein CrcB [Nonlabens dokdonensis]|uniref:Fluoride-specific ion channel FluC n=2 Tax=Nonlabens dokdonensis TaxID=328515 RepID=L7WCG2_NONDD|nr:fluoride efflux transporter CrcB [Nonlabens dokdonensis]AGC77774.1 CrcB-like protein [Nonlabens dokdonensis DSW-6]PZX39692.1 camphor resistance protein CrcB [Nonlabens dokdonensis]